LRNDEISYDIELSNLFIIYFIIYCLQKPKFLLVLCTRLVQSPPYGGKIKKKNSCSSLRKYYVIKQNCSKNFRNNL